MLQRSITGSVQPKNGKFYIVLNLYEDGKRKPKWIPTGLPVRGNKRKAEDMMSAAIHEHNEQLNRPSRLKNAKADMLFVDYMRLWLGTKKRNIMPLTYEGYEMMINGRIDSYFTACKSRLSTIEPEDIEDFYETMYDDGLKGSSVIHYHAIIKQALSYAVKKDILNFNPMDKIDRPKKNHFIADHYTKDEALRLFEAAKGDPIYILILIATYYGMRRSEVLGLRWRSVDLESGFISINHKVIQEKVNGISQPVGYDDLKTQASRRTLPLIPNIAEVLKAEKERQAENRRIFRNAYNQDGTDYVCVDALGKLFSPNYVSGHFSWLLKKHELRRIRFHDLRHTCASLLVANGVPMKQIQLWLGHSNYNTTADIYAHLDHKAQEQSAQVIAELLG